MNTSTPAFLIEENNLIVRALSILIGELATQPDTDSAFDISTIMQMSMEEMTEKGINTQPQRIAFLSDRLNSITLSNAQLADEVQA